jgi:hypothetical protein
MASSGLAMTGYLYSFTQATNAGKTGDAANMVARIVADGTEATPAGAVTEVDATNCPGLYKVALTGAENTGFGMVLHGKTTTGGVTVLPFMWTNEQLPTAAPAAANGLITRGSGAGQIAPDGSGNVPLSATTDNAIADAVLDRANAIETGITLRQGMRYIAAALAGVLSGAGTGTIVIKAINNAGTTRITATVDASGDRSVIVLA